MVGKEVWVECVGLSLSLNWLPFYCRIVRKRPGSVVIGDSGEC